MSVEERLRAAARARTDLVGGIRPLELPAESPARVRRSRHARRWLNWGAPIAAAALVTALALTLVLLRQAGDPRPVPSAPASDATAAVSVPRYYVELAYTGSNSSQMKAIVGDDRTGRLIADLHPTATQNFYGVTAAADDRTFVVMNYDNLNPQTTWYLLRIAPYTAHPARLTKLPIKPVFAHVSGLALSPDGRELAVMYRTATTATNAKTYFTVYSVSSGAVLAAWHMNGPNNWLIGGDGNGAGLSWVNGDRTVDFLWSIPPTESNGKFTPEKLTLRALDIAAGGHDLMADSRLVRQFPPVATDKQTSTWTDPCANPLATRDGTVVCGPAGGSNASGVAAKVPLSVVSYSAATGKPLYALYRYDSPELNANFEVVWTDPAGSHAIVFLLVAEKGVKSSASDKFGVVGGGHFTPLPPLTIRSGSVYNQGGIAF